jgi:hypothetical protein
MGEETPLEVFIESYGRIIYRDESETKANKILFFQSFPKRSIPQDELASRLRFQADCRTSKRKSG